MNPWERQPSYEQIFGGAERFSLSPSEEERAGVRGNRRAAVEELLVQRRRPTPSHEPERRGSAGFPTCCIADFQIGAACDVARPAGLETRDTADLEVRATNQLRFMVPTRDFGIVEASQEPERRAMPWRRESGAKVARTPNASRQRGGSVPRVSAWSAGDFSAALAQPRVKRTVLGFKARNLVSENSHPNSLPFRRGEGNDCGKAAYPTNLSVKSQPSQPNPAGFTLIELVISAALASMILVSAYLCLNSAIASRKLIEPRVDVLQSARVAMAILTADLRAACPLSKEFQFLGLDRRLGDVQADNLDFATHNYTPRRSREGDYCQVSVFLEKDPRSGEYVLWRRRNPTIAPDPLSGGAREELARGLRGVQFEYYDGLDWYDTWGEIPGVGKVKSSLRDQSNRYGMPEAVRITLAFDTRSSSKAAAPTEPTTIEPPLVFRTVVRLNLAASSLPAGSGNEGSSAPTLNGGGLARGVN